MKIADINTKIAARVDNAQNKVAKERELWSILVNEACKLYEVKEIDVNLTVSPTYITDNFSPTGLGIGAMDGFAICNGNNGTKNRNGLTSIGYGTSYPTVGATGGSKDAVVVSHTHTYSKAVPGRGYDTAADDYPFSSNASDTTSSTGESGVGKNMQPYIVTLMIQRIA